MTIPNLFDEIELTPKEAMRRLPTLALKCKIAGLLRRPMPVSYDYFWKVLTLAKKAETQPTSFVYFIADGRQVKIGTTTSLSTRLRQLQLSNPRQLKVLAAFPGTAVDELELHRQLKKYRLHGEWFELVPTIRQVIKDLRRRHQANR